jgi:hypothetical protein
MMEEAGVQVLLHTMVVDTVIEENIVKGVQLAEKF